MRWHAIAQGFKTESRHFTWCIYDESEYVPGVGIDYRFVLWAFGKSTDEGKVFITMCKTLDEVKSVAQKLQDVLSYYPHSTQRESN